MFVKKQKVRYIGSEQDQMFYNQVSVISRPINSWLRKNFVYQIEDTEVREEHTLIKLEGMDGWFLPVCFEEVKEKALLTENKVNVNKPVNVNLVNTAIVGVYAPRGVYPESVVGLYLINGKLYFSRSKDVTEDVTYLGLVEITAMELVMMGFDVIESL